MWREHQHIGPIQFVAAGLADSRSQLHRPAADAGGLRYGGGDPGVLPKTAVTPMRKAMKLGWRPISEPWALGRLLLATRTGLVERAVLDLARFLAPSSPKSKSGRTKRQWTASMGARTLLRHEHAIPNGRLGRVEGAPTRTTDRRPVCRQDPCRVRSGRRQDRAASGRRSAAQLAHVEERYVAVATRAVAQ